MTTHTSRRAAARRTALAVTALTFVTAHLAIAPQTAYAADPAGCTRSGSHITCTNGVPKGQTLTGTSGNDTIEITGTVAGTVDGGDGDDVIVIRGRNGAPGATWQHGGKGESAVQGGRVLGGAGNDIITIIGGSGGTGGEGIYKGGVGAAAGDGGDGGNGMWGGYVDGGSGVNIITVQGGNGGNGGSAKSELEPGHAGIGGGGMAGGQMVVGKDKHSSLDVHGGNGGAGGSNTSGLRGGDGSGNYGVEYGARIEGGSSPDGVTISITGGNGGTGSKGGHGGAGMVRSKVTGTPGDDEITAQGGKGKEGTGAGLGGSGDIDAKEGNDTVTVYKNAGGDVVCGDGNDTYKWARQRGLYDRKSCEHVQQIR
ncbi:hypothetical protein ACH4PU_33375 [Streptomyces sp. NPDC021100]|uniref:hypothetical protein n=1 Tax=Streptomyces sp. NPDC021100 TaxID=3365114 RepID=UPI0037ADF043